MCLLVLFISPSVITTADSELASCANSSRFAHAEKEEKEKRAFSQAGEKISWTVKPGPF